MSEIIGRQLEIGVSVEQSRGVPQGAAEKWVKNMTASVIEKAENVIDESSHGSIADSDGKRVVKKWAEGDIEGNVHADAIGYFLYNIYGSVSSSFVASGVYNHAFSDNNSIQHPSLALFAKDGSVQQRVFGNAMINTLEISATSDEIVSFTASFIADVGSVNADTPGYDCEYDFIGRDVTIKLADTEAGLVGATATKIKELTITFDQGVVADHVLGQYNPEDIFNTKKSIEVAINKNYVDTTFEDLYSSSNAKYMLITIEGEANIGTNNKPTITLLLNKAQVTEWERSGAADEIVVEDITIKAFYNCTDGQQSEMTLKNKTPEYSSAPSV